jgi:hypothetical protein
MHSSDDGCATESVDSVARLGDPDETRIEAAAAERR